MIAQATPPEAPAKRVSLSRLWADYVESRVSSGFMRDGGRRQRPVIEDLRKFLRHDDARRITKKNLMEWRDKLMAEKSAKTVNDIYLSAVRSLFSWAVENDRLPENVAGNVRQRKPKRAYSRERGFTDAEALKILKASRSYQPKVDEFGNVRETESMIATKRWVPILCAFSGARVSEITQLRKEDVRQEGGRWVARITPEAGTVKAGGYRDVPLHRQIVEEGFVEFVKAAPDGPLFHQEKDPAKFASVAGQMSNRLATWLRTSGLRPEGVQPNHGWRHRLKTQCRELGMSDRVVDAIQGHSGKTAGDNYGDVTLKTKVDAIDRLPSYSL
jgi:integrase